MRHKPQRKPKPQQAEPHAPRQGVAAPGIYSAAWHGDLEYLHRLLNEGGDADALSEGWTPLHAACRHGHLKCVQALVTADVKLSVRDADGLTAAEVAYTYGHAACGKLVEQHDAQQRAAAASRRSPVRQARLKTQRATSSRLAQLSPRREALILTKKPAGKEPPPRRQSSRPRLRPRSARPRSRGKEAPAALPEGWIQVVSKSTGNVLYINPATGECEAAPPRPTTAPAASSPTRSGNRAAWDVQPTRRRPKSPEPATAPGSPLRRSRSAVPRAGLSRSPQPASPAEDHTAGTTPPRSLRCLSEGTVSHRRVPADAEGASALEAQLQSEKRDRELLSGAWQHITEPSSCLPCLSAYSGADRGAVGWQGNWSRRRPRCAVRSRRPRQCETAHSQRSAAVTQPSRVPPCPHPNRGSDSLGCPGRRSRCRCCRRS